ncbi:hypothetical protein N0V93_006325 [Gnomoniopsis smithogilvyi]|uniref:D-mandelate dehydrogenase n=1 Tax=Gnomoniopsis smithogilvyi TaxID=1191159 RepID=A0A9W9CUM0_9PEZI|nr:hypothetical protein N0V93_006325 [Gnomoniopsis smithogilvyi]
MAASKPTILHIGDPIKYNPQTHAVLAQNFTIIRPSTEERQRPAFLRALRERKWGDFAAIMRPFWGTGGEMGKWDDELIGALPASVRVFASAGAGFDWADTEALGRRGIIYCNGGLAAAESVADFAVAMVISTFRQLPWTTAAALIPYLNSPPSGPNKAAEAAFAFSHNHTTAHARNPRNHTLGLIGLGKIGQLIAAKLGNPTMGMKIAYYDVVRKPAELEKQLGATFHPTLESLLGVSDCAVLCTPASPDGGTVVNARSLAWLKRGGRFVNIARGSLVDEEALADALESGVVSSAGLDVHADEPRVSRRLLGFAGLDIAAAGTQGGKLDANGQGLNPGRVLLTCHNAGGTVETHIGFEELAMRNVLAVLSGKDAITPVNLHFLKGARESRL